ncbi:major histocompatibility complex class I-related gene protein-like [Gastrophryne carolinensis]
MRGSLGGEMAALILLLTLGVSAVQCDSHSLRFYKTAVSSPGHGLPVYSSVGYVDDQEITNYNSDTHQCLPKVEWMKKVGEDYWERNTQRGQVLESAYKRNVQTAMRRHNQTGGIHFFQVMYGCELRDDGSTTGYVQHGYDGRNLMYLDAQRGIFIPTMNGAQITTQSWNSPHVRSGEIHKNYLENECIDWLKKYISYGREDLERREPPPETSWIKVAIYIVIAVAAIAVLALVVVIWRKWPQLQQRFSREQHGATGYVIAQRSDPNPTATSNPTA